MIKLPDEVINIIFSYLSSPTSIIMKPYIESYDNYCGWISEKFDRMSFSEYMMVNAMYLDYTSKRHSRENAKILKMFISLNY